MEFKIEKRANPNTKNYTSDELSIAYEFAKKAHHEFGDMIKALVLFGSAAKRTGTNRKDIDIMIVFDDVTINLTPEIVNTYRILVEKIVADTSTRLHITTIKLTTFWEYIRAGDPIGMNILRDGVALLDTGFFDPVRALLARGRIRPSAEAIWTYFARAPRTIHNSKWHVMQAVLDLYWAVIDSAHAALMKIGEVPPSPEHVSDMISKVLVAKGLVDKSAAKTMDFFYHLNKRITHREIQKITGAEYDTYKKQAEIFVAKMKKIIV